MGDLSKLLTQVSSSFIAIVLTILMPRTQPQFEVGETLYFRAEPFVIAALRQEVVLVKSLQREELCWVLPQQDLLKYFSRSRSC